jgi:hypothetical protein
MATRLHPRVPFFTDYLMLRIRHKTESGLFTAMLLAYRLTPLCAAEGSPQTAVILGAY